MLVSCDDKCGLCYENKRRRANHRGHRFYVAPRKGYAMALSKSGFVGGGGDDGNAGGVVPTDDKLAKVAPTVESFLREECWEDGTKRTTGSLLVFCEGGSWRVMLNDRDANVVGFRSGTSLEGALKAAEKALANGSMDWRASRQGKGRR